LPIPPNYVLETSAGRFQAFYLFDKPEELKVVKPIAERLKAFARCDHGTSDISHVWRVPGALNWPNAKKVADDSGATPKPGAVRGTMWRPSERWRSGWDGEFESPLLQQPVCLSSEP
jgi:hypothetical protein